MTQPSSGPFELYTIGLDSFTAGDKVVPAGGSVNFDFGPPDGSRSWIVGYIVGTLSTATQASSSATGAQLQLFTDALQWNNLWDLCTVGLGVGVVGWYSPPRRLGASQRLVAQFTGANQGDVARVRCEYAYLG